jgi:predicted RNase H-like HicB family nuclease
MQRYVLLYRDEVPSLQGCISQGDSREEALVNIQEAIELYLEDAEAHGEDYLHDFIDPELVLISF